MERGLREFFFRFFFLSLFVGFRFPLGFFVGVVWDLEGGVHVPRLVFFLSFFSVVCFGWCTDGRSRLFVSYSSGYEFVL